MDIDTARHAFAEELRYVAHVRSDRVIAAFATVPRERFLGPPPWQVFDLTDGYWEIPGDDPGAAYHNVLFAIDAARELNNGHPEFWARLLDKLDIRAGDKVFHVGAGLGYYTAIMAELAGADGAVVAVEIDPGLAERARANLASRANVQVIATDGAVFDPGPVDVIVVNAGATQPMPVWLACVDAGRAAAAAAHGGGRPRHGVPDRTPGHAGHVCRRGGVRRSDLSVRRCAIGAGGAASGSRVGRWGAALRPLAAAGPARARGHVLAARRWPLPVDP